MIVLAVDATDDRDHPTNEFLFHPFQSRLLIWIGSAIRCFHGVVGEVVKFVLCAVDSMQLPRPVVPRSMAGCDVFGELRELIDVLADPLWVVGQGGAGLLLFHDRFLDSVTPGRLSLLEEVPKAHRLATRVGPARDDVADVGSIKRVRSMQRNSGHC